jgi:hypothetical protein
VTDRASPGRSAAGAPAPADGPAPAAFLALDRGSATCAVALVGRIGRRWRLLAAAAAPAGADAAVLGELLVARVRAADPALADEIGLEEAAPTDGPGAAPGSAGGVETLPAPWATGDLAAVGNPVAGVPAARTDASAGADPAADAGAAPPATPPSDGRLPLARLEATSAPPPLAAVLAATEVARARLEADAGAAGWRTVGASAEHVDPLAVTRLATRGDVAMLIVGTGDPPSGGERDLLGELIALAAAVAERRPGMPVVLVGAAAAHAPAFPLRTEIVPVARPRGDAAGDLRAILAARRAGPGDARQALVVAAAALAELLDLRVELLEIGMGGGLRARAAPGARPGEPAVVAAAEVPAAALGLVGDEVGLDRVEGWTTVAIDRARLRDRLAELRLAPWADAGGDGALLRAAALRAAVGQLVAATDDGLGGPAPDLLVLAGGTWASIPASAALLVVADALRRPGVVQVAADPTRLLAPLGTVDDPAERARLLRDLLPDAVAPLGTLVIARGARGRPAGHLRLVGEGEPVELDLAGGSLALVDLPPGQAGSVELSFRSAVDLGVRGRRFAVRATGGLAGLVVDLRDVPLRLPERAEDRRAALARWERALWPDRDR